MDKEKIKIILNNFALIFSSSIILICIFFIGAFLYLDIFYAQKIYPKVKIAGIEAGGKTKEELNDFLISRVQEWNEQKTIIKTNDKELEFFNKELSVDFDINESLSQAFLVGRQGNLSRQFLDRLSLMFFGSNKKMLIRKDNFEGISRKISEDFDVAAANIRIIIKDGVIETTEEKLGRKVNKSQFKYLIFKQAGYLSSEIIEIPQIIVYPNSEESATQNVKNDLEELLNKIIIVKAKNKKWELGKNDIYNLIKIDSNKQESIEIQKNKYLINNYFKNLLEDLNISHFVNEKPSIHFKKEKLIEYLKKYASQIDLYPKNAVLKIESEKVIVAEPSKEGEILNLELSVDLMFKMLEDKKTEITLPTKKVKASVREDNLLELGIIEMIGKGESDFSGSSSARKNNIKVGASKFNGLLIAPGEEFSFNKNLGEVDASTGFLPELVIKPGKMVKEYGGGLCQVATTAFRAALLSALSITERKNHSFVVNYYLWPYTAPGVDATIYSPHPDLRFKNDTGKYILIQTRSEGNKLFFEFYGTKGEKRAILETPQIIERGSNGSMKTVFSRSIYLGEKLIKKDDFYSNYKPAVDFPVTDN